MKKKLLIGIGGLFFLCVLLGIIVGSCGDLSTEPTSTPRPTLTHGAVDATKTTYTPWPSRTPSQTPAPSYTPQPTNTPEPTNTSRPTDTPAPTATPVPPPEPVVLSGSGQQATEEFYLPSTISVANFTHNGSSNFVVKAYVDSGEELLVNEIGSYQGSRPLVSSGPVMLDIRADGAWTVKIVPLGLAASSAFSGKGDAVSGIFDPPSRGAWEISHDGSSNFVVKCHCVGGSGLVQNEIGAVSGSRVVTFGEGPCFWEVRADGNWSLRSR